MEAKEFLGTHEVDHRSVNAREGEGIKIHEELGEPPVPSLVVDGNVYGLLHTTQIASILDLPMPDGTDKRTTRMAWDSVSILESFIGLLRKMDFDMMLQPTKSRQRSPRNLTVNVFHPFALLPGAFEDGTFEWHTKESDERREAELTTAEDVIDWAQDCLVEFQSFLLDEAEELDEKDPHVVTSNRGEASFSVLLQSQRSHAAVHHRQVVDFLNERGVDVSDALDVDGIADLKLPEAIY